MSLEPPVLRSVILMRDRIEDSDVYPFSIPAVQALDGLELSAVTYNFLPQCFERECFDDGASAERRLVDWVRAMPASTRAICAGPVGSKDRARIKAA